MQPLDNCPAQDVQNNGVQEAVVDVNIRFHTRPESDLDVETISNQGDENDKDIPDYLAH